MEEVHRWHFMIWPHGMDSLLKFINHLNIVHPTIKFTSDISDTEISFLDLQYIYNSHNYILDYTLRLLIDTCIWITFQNILWALRSLYHIHSSWDSKEYTLNPNIYLEAQICMCLFFMWRKYPVTPYQKPGWKLESSQGNNCWQQETMKTRIYHLCLSQHIVGPIPILRNSSKHWAYLGRSSATREFGKKGLHDHL